MGSIGQTKKAVHFTFSPNFLILSYILYAYYSIKFKYIKNVTGKAQETYKKTRTTAILLTVCQNVKVDLIAEDTTHCTQNLGEINLVLTWKPKS